MRARRFGVFALVAGLGLAVAQPAGATSPTAVLEAFFEGANVILKTVDPFGDLEQPRQAVRELVNEFFDFRGASALALGSAWVTRTPDEQDEFVRLFAIFLERGFIGMIGAKASVSDGVKIQYVDESIGDEWAGVATSLLARNGQELPVDYWFVRRGDRWKVQDVVIDGVSLIANYRSQFTRVLAAYPYSEVLARLGGSQPDAPAMVAAPAPQVAGIVPAAQAAPPVPQVSQIPRIPPVTQSPWSANPAAPPPAAGTALSPRTFQEIHLTALPSEVSSSERVRAPVAAQFSEIRERSGPARDGQAAGAYWIQLGVFQSLDAAAHLAGRFSRDGATISKTWLTNAAGNRVGVWARVRVGPFANRSEAVSKLQDLSARGQAGFIAEARD
jgi:phospholipid transport system substrate-binding protein